MKINWKQKLTSRKFWAAIVGFITPVLLAFGVSESVVTQTAAIIMAGASLIAYIIGEGLVDAAAADAAAYFPAPRENAGAVTLYNTDGEGL